MANRSVLWITALMLVSTLDRLMAETTNQPHEASLASNSGVATSSFIRTDRLSRKQLKTWQSIRDIVFAKDASGTFKHPKLRELWQKAEETGYAFYIEFRKPSFRYDPAVGEFYVEKPDSSNQEPAAVIWLFLSVIDHVQVDPGIQKKLGFIPFLGMSKTERYAAVLGHELSHAVWILADPNLTKLCERSMNTDAKKSDFHGEMRERRIKMESLMGDLEMRARAAEAVISEELRAGRRKVKTF